MTVPAHTARQRGLVACHRCHRLTRRRETLAECPRCGAALHSRKPNSIARCWALVLAAVVAGATGGSVVVPSCSEIDAEKVSSTTSS